MLELLGVVAPLGLSAAVSPVMLSEQLLLVAGPRGRRVGAMFAAGTVLVVAAVVVLVSVVGRSIELPKAPHLDATADVVLGALLVVAGGLVERRRRRAPKASPQPRERRSMTPAQAFGFGVFSMATNVTTLTLVVVATKDVAARGAPLDDRVVPLVVLVVLATVPAWLPVLLAGRPGGRVDTALTRLGDLATKHGQQLLVVVLVLVGAFLVGRGALELARL